MHSLLADLKALAEGYESAEPWETWFARNNQSLASLLNRGDYLRLKLRRAEAIPDILKKFDVVCVPRARFDAELLRSTAHRMKLSKEEQSEIVNIMQNKDGYLGIAPCFEKLIEADKRVDNSVRFNNLAGALPTWSAEHIRAYIADMPVMLDSSGEWFFRGIARRFALGDAAELGRFASIQARVNWLMWGNKRVEEDSNVSYVLSALAAKDFSAALRFVETGTFPLIEGDPARKLIYNSVYAILKKDFEYLKSLVPALSKRSSPAWRGAIHSCLIGIAQQSPDLVAEGIQKSLKLHRRILSLSVLTKTIGFWAHGLFELARWVSPDLVSQFNVEQPLPWDADFQKWARQCDAPLKDISLAHIAPNIHEAIIELRIPSWWDARPQ